MFGDFEIGREYSRRLDIHRRFDGQAQGGISTPQDHKVIFLFTGESGEQHGYSDGWDRGVFRYFGEGQIGPMQWVRGNRAIRDQVKDGKDLLLFRTLGHGKPVRFVGSFDCVGWESTLAPDREGNQRQAFVFHLLPTGEIEASPTSLDSNDESESEGEGEGEGEEASTNLIESRRKALEASSSAPQISLRDARRNYVARSASVRNYVLSRAQGYCEGCGQQAPFTTRVGAPYLEPHHCRRLSDGGPDDPRHMAALCPNCHRRVHFGDDGGAYNGEIAARVYGAESLLDR